MDNKTPLYNSRIIKTYLEYLDKYHPDIDGDALLEYAGITKHEICDPAHFLTQYQINRFHEILSRKTDDPHISREVGRYVTSAETFGTIKAHLLGLLSTLQMYELAAKTIGNLTHHVTIGMKELGPHKIEMDFTIREDVREEPFQCENRLGSLESLARLHTNNYANVEHTRCVHKGDEVCSYIISWQHSPGLFWKRIRNYALIAGLFIIIIAWFFLPILSWGILTGAYITVTTALSLYCGRLEKKELLKTIELQSKSALNLVEQSNRQYSTALLIQQLGQATSTVLDVRALCRTVMHIMQKHLDFDNGTILLVNEARDKLVHIAGYGYGEDEDDPLKNMEFSIDNPDGNELVVQSFISKQPVFIDDISAIEESVNPDSLQFYKRAGINSCICIPIVYERESLGVLYIDNETAENPFTLSDWNLLMGIASQIGIGIINSRSFRKIQESEQRYKTIFENTSNATIIMEEDTTISFVNSQFEKLSGYTRSEIENKMRWTKFVTPEDYERMMDQHRLRRIAPNDAVKNYSFRFKDRHGDIKDIFLTVDMIPNTKKSVASLLDITESKQAGEALKKSEERYRLLAENVHDVIWVMDLNFRYTYISPSVENLKGFSVEEAMSMSLEEIYTQNSYRMVKDVISRELSSYITHGIHPQKSVTLEVEQICKDGSTVWTEVTASLLFDEKGTPTGILGITRDISERKKAGEEKKRLETQLQQAQKMEAIGTLAGGIAHDFNNLLMGIQGNASLILSDINLTHSHYERLKNIEQYVRDGAGLTRQLLGFARGGKYEVKPTDTNEIIDKSSEMFGRTRKEITIHKKFQDDIWTVEIDRGQIEQVLLNLYVNAWQAMSAGGEIFLETQNVVLDNIFVEPYHLPAGNYVKISVTDTGVGMDEKMQKRIFEPFFTTKEMSRGTGLGLASAYGIIMNHQGIINVSSVKGEGTTFNIYLPASQKDIEQEKEPPREILTGSETILLVDDQELILEVGAQMLEKLGYTVMVANGGKKALEVYTEKTGSIDLVILDMIMPDFSGREIYDALKKVNDQVRVLLSSGYSVESQAKDILDRGCNGFIQKPFDLKGLSRKLREIFNDE